MDEANRGRFRLLLLEWMRRLYEVRDGAEEAMGRLDDSASNLAYGRLSPEMRDNHMGRVRKDLSAWDKALDEIEAIIDEMRGCVGDINAPTEEG